MATLGFKLAAEPQGAAWTVKKAGASFSRLFAEALYRPQFVTRRDAEEVVVVNATDFRAATAPGAETLVELVSSMEPDPELSKVLHSRVTYGHRQL